MSKKLLVVFAFIIILMFASSNSSVAAPSQEGTTTATLDSTPQIYQQFVIAIQNIPRGTKISADAVALALWPAKYVPDTVVVRLDDVVGKTSSNDIFAGEPILEGMLAAQNSVTALNTLELNQPYLGKLTLTEIWYEQWALKGTANQTISITMRGVMPYIMVWNQRTQLIVDGKHSYDKRVATLTVTLPSNDTYTVTATRQGLFSGTSIGTFCIIAVQGDKPADCTG